MLRLGIIHQDEDSARAHRMANEAAHVFSGRQRPGHQAQLIHILLADSLPDRLEASPRDWAMVDLWVVLFSPGLLTVQPSKLEIIGRLIGDDPPRAIGVLAQPCDPSMTVLGDVRVIAPGGRALSDVPNRSRGWEEVLAAAPVWVAKRIAGQRGTTRVSHVEGLAVSNLTAFQDVELQFSRGINVFLGTNGTGKTHLLKAMYASLSATGQIVGEHGDPVDLYELFMRLRQKLVGVFRPAEGDLARLLRVGGQEMDLTVVCKGGALKLQLSEALNAAESDRVPVPSSVLFIPSREGLSLFEGFLAAWEKRELSIDETYRDLCVALSASRLKGPPALEAARLIDDLGEALGGDVELKGGRFVIRRAGDAHDLEAHLLAEGLRKLASLVQLIRNGSLTRDTILFWDEPEANLNPKLAEKVVQVLLRLAAHGVQVFLATHDYLVAHKLSLAAEWSTHPAVDLRFFSFWRDEAMGAYAPVQVQVGRTLAELEHDPILEEYLAFAEREETLLAASGE